MYKRYIEVNRWLHVHRFLLWCGCWRVSSVCVCVIVCLRWNGARVAIAAIYLITYSGGNWEKKKPGGKEEGKQQLNPPAARNIPSFNVTFNIQQQLPSVYWRSLMSCRGSSFIHHWDPYNISAVTVYTFLCIYPIIRQSNCYFAPPWKKINIRDHPEINLSLSIFFFTDRK